MSYFFFAKSHQQLTETMDLVQKDRVKLLSYLVFGERRTSVTRENKNMSASRIIPFSVQVFAFAFFSWNVLSFMFESVAKNEL